MADVPQEELPDFPLDGNAKDFVLSQYLCADRVQGFIDANSACLDLSLEFALRMYNEMDLETASGQLLERIGSWLGAPRIRVIREAYSPSEVAESGLMTDEHYRRYLRSVSKVLFSCGTANDIQAITRSYLEGATPDTVPFVYAVSAVNAYQVKVHLAQSSVDLGGGEFDVNWDPLVLQSLLKCAAPFNTRGTLIWSPPGSFHLEFGTGFYQQPCPVGGLNNANPVYCVPRAYDLSPDQRQDSGR